MASSLPAGSKAHPSQRDGVKSQLSSFLQNCKGYVSTQEAQKWSVYSLRPSGWFKHHSLLFQLKEGSNFYFVIELLKEPIQGSYLACIQARVPNLKKNAHLKAVHLGDITNDMEAIISMAYSTLTKMGSYNALLNNCQDYCKLLAKNLNCSDYMSDTETTLALVALAALASTGLYLLYKLFSKDSKDE